MVNNAKISTDVGTVSSLLPYFACGKVVRGFGRGSKELGCPTANMSDHVVSEFPQALPCGVYYGLANVDNGSVYRMVTSVGWNPQYNNNQKTIEVHVLHNFQDDFYGSVLKIVLLGYLRPMRAFPSLDALKEAIHSDIDEAHQILGRPEFRSYESNTYFTVGGEDGAPPTRKISDIVPASNEGGCDVKKSMT